MRNKVLLTTLLLLAILTVTEVTNAGAKVPGGRTRHCIAFVEEENGPGKPMECFTDKGQFERRSREIESAGPEMTLNSQKETAMGTTSGYVMLAQIWDNNDWTGDTMKIYGSACNVAGWLNSLDFMNNRTSSFYMPCSGQISGYYYTTFAYGQNGSGGRNIWSQVNDGPYERLYWPFDNSYESFANTCCQDCRDIPGW